MVHRDRRLRVEAAAIARAIHVLDSAAGRFRDGPRRGELTISFLQAKSLANLHAKFLGDPSATDVMTFSGMAAAGQAGEICISAAAAVEYSERHHVPFSEEALRYVLHGWLHLAGYDDRQPQRKRTMRRAEERALDLLRNARAIPKFFWK